MNPDPSLPTFLVIGAGKSGTTAIHEFLRQHPNISLPWRKETHFFVLTNFEKQPRQIFPRELINPIENLSDYLADFEDKGSGQIRGEVCPTYLSYEATSRNIYKSIPNAKIICILRDPVERFLSAYVFSKNRDLSRKGELITPTNDMLRQDIESLKRGKASNLLEWNFNVGKYYKQLCLYYELFPTEQIKVFFYENFQNDPGSVMNEITDFIGASPFAYNTGMKFNVSGNFRFPILYKWLKGSRFARLIRKNTSTGFYQKLRAMAEKAMFHQANIMTADLRAELQQMYREDIIALEKLLKKDLSGWLRP